MYFQQEAALPLQVVADGHSTATALVTSTPALAATVVVWTLGEIVLDILWAGCAASAPWPRP